ncbi:hypothetical protein [Streptomyces nojiriensis]|uniref:hypothetical protein n=1 Tax=Streptomyces nojiriensis TaxID=66374 RepID=UPI00369A519A
MARGPVTRDPADSPLPVASRSFGTPKLRTRIDPAGDGYLWHRTRMYASTGAPPDGVGGVWHAAARRSGNTFTYLLPDASSAADLIVPGAGRAAQEHAHACAALAGVGRALRVHAEARPPAGTAPAPLGAVQIVRWITAPADTAAGEGLRAGLSAAVGTQRMERLHAWADALTRTSRSAISLHGELSLAAVIPRRGGIPAVLYGESISRGPLEYDAGWLLGELAELNDLSVLGGNRDDGEHLGCHARSFAHPIASLLDPEILGRCVVLRRLMHIIDYARFFGTGPLARYIDDMPELIDSSGMNTLARMSIDSLPAFRR